MQSELNSVGVIGHTGMVGGAVYKYFEKSGRPTYGYSKSQSQNKLLVTNSSVIFICVPTPFNWDTNAYDGTIVESALSDIADERVVVIKSTVPIGTTDALQEKYPNLKLLFNPEFLSEATAYGDFVNPDRQFLGWTKRSYEVSIAVLNMLPESAYGVTMPAKEAELLKYINNLHGSLAVIEANHYYDVCKKEGLDYERVIKAAEASKWVGAPMGRQYHNVNHKGFRGFGGKCFPKDINAWIQYCQEQGIPCELFNTVRDVNRTYLKKQDLTEAQAEKR